MTIARAYDLFMKDRSGYCSAKTLETYSGHMKVFFRFLESKFISADLLTFEALPPDVNILSDYILYLRLDYSGSITNTTIRSYVRPVKAFLRFCYEEDICKDYLKRVKLPKLDAVPPAPLLAEEVMRLDACFDLSSLKGLRNYCIVHLMLDCGLRSQEVLHLENVDIDAAHHLLHIRISKECKSRITMIPDFLSGHILKYMQRCGRSSGTIFYSLKQNQPLTGNSIKQLFQDLKQQSDIPRLHAHLLRHTFATAYLCGGGNLEFLRVLMGHSDYGVTKIYSSLAAQYKMLGVPIYQLDPVFFQILG
ncbi:MAG: tyrosine-type recombinase/integrase [Acetatifactor sp.]|nr:tyrosine-type recombinase/integrase [Acetatifactor sp.]